MLSLRSSDEIAYDGSNNTCRMDLFADTASDLTGVTTFDSIVLLAGSSALDISTGDLYRMQSDGTWILQPGTGAFSNVYTKAEIDSMLLSYYTKAEADELFVWNTVTLSGTDTIYFYAKGAAIEWNIYGNMTADTPPDECGDKTANLFSEPLSNGYTLNGTTGLPSAYDKRCATLNPINVSDLQNVTITFSASLSRTRVIYSLFDDSTLIRRVTAIFTGTSIDVSDGNKLYICFYDTADTETVRANDISNLMLNAGTEPIPYIPYGYAIPITCGTAQTVYLPEPLRKALDGSGAVDVMSSDGTITRNVDSDGNELTPPTTETFDAPTITPTAGENTLTVDTTLPPSEITITGQIREA